MKQEKQVWEKSRAELFRELGCQESGLTQADAESRLAKYGANELHAGRAFCKSFWGSSQIFWF